MKYEIIGKYKKNTEVWTSAKNKKEAIKIATDFFLKGGEVLSKYPPCREIIIRPLNNSLQLKNNMIK